MNSNQGSRKEIYYISVLSVISAVAVIFNHSSLARFYAALPLNYWFITNFIMSITMFAVPVFYMISGATLINYNERYDTKTYFLKRIKRVVIPYIFWVIVYTLFSIYFLKIPLNDNIIIFIYKNCIYGSLYWFFIPLFAIYIIIPLLSHVMKEKQIQLFKFYSIVIFAYALYSSLIIIFGIDMPLYNEFMFTSIFFIYPLLGYILNETDLSKKYRFIFYGLGIIGFLCIFIPNQIFHDTAGQATNLYTSYMYPTTILFSIAVWILIKQLFTVNFTGKALEKTVNFIKPHIFGLYLIHFYIIELLTNCLNLTNTQFLFSIGMPFIVIPLAITILHVMKRIPIVKNVIP